MWLGYVSLHLQLAQWQLLRWHEGMCHTDNHLVP
jgi:hypothetical protein